MADVERTRRILAIELLLKRIMTLQHEQDVARETIAEKDKLIERLVEVIGELFIYGRHFSDCPAWDGDEKYCNCGLFKVDEHYAALLAELEGKGSEPTESHGK